jgi:hypothetical protein
MICQGPYFSLYCPREIDHEVIEDSSNAVYGGAVFHAIQTIPVNPSGPTIQTSAIIVQTESGWDAGGNAFVVGNPVSFFASADDRMLTPLASLKAEEVTCHNLRFLFFYNTAHFFLITNSPIR